MDIKQRLSEIKDYDEDYIGQANEIRRNIIIKEAVRVADEIILEYSDGSCEETDYLTSAIAQEFIKKAHIANTGRLLKNIFFKEIEGDM